MASESPHFPLSKIPLPEELLQTTSGFLDALDVSQIELVSRKAREIFSHPDFWKTVEKQLGLSPAANPRRHVVDYYGWVANVALETLDPQKTTIPRVDDVFAQCALIEKYLREHPEALDDPEDVEFLMTCAAEYPAFAFSLCEIFSAHRVFQNPAHRDLLKNLVKTCRDEDVAVVRKLLESGVNKDEGAVTTAALLGHARILQALLEAKVPIPENALHLACVSGRLECVRLLLAHRAPVADWNALIQRTANYPAIQALLTQARPAE